jgi:hypothetical protein
VYLVGPTILIFFLISGWGTMQHGAPKTPILGPILFTICTNELPLRINSVSEPILYADDTSVIISSRNYEDFCSVSNFALSVMSLNCLLLIR